MDVPIGEEVAGWHRRSRMPLDRSVRRVTDDVSWFDDCVRAVDRVLVTIPKGNGRSGQVDHHALRHQRNRSNDRSGVTFMEDDVGAHDVLFDGPPAVVLPPEPGGIRGTDGGGAGFAAP